MIVIEKSIYVEENHLSLKIANSTYMFIFTSNFLIIHYNLYISN